jgi:virginiamycin A acetyltransferase
MKSFIKSVANCVFLVLALLPAALSGFGSVEAIFLLFAQACALIPGIVGDYLRIAYYKLTLAECALEARIQFGSFFAHSKARVGRDVYIGSYCVLGRTTIGDRTQIASGVQILSGRRQHARDSEGRLRGSDYAGFTEVVIGADCWIGASAIVMAEVGAGSTVAAGAVVVKPIPAGSVAAGSPARVVKTVGAEIGDE